MFVVDDFKSYSSVCLNFSNQLLETQIFERLENIILSFAASSNFLKFQKHSFIRQIFKLQTLKTEIID
jgi:hypothetical protein